MNAYFSAMSQPICEHSGIIDKYIGDAIMAFWVPPFSDPNRQAEYACRAALEQLALLDALNRRVPDIVGLRRDVPNINFRAGLSTGEVVVGSVGSETARSFTVMGDTVNQASRLEAANKVYGTNVLIDHETYAAAGSAIETRLIDEIKVVGRDEPLQIYELAAMAGDLAADKRALFDVFAEGLEHYKRADWSKAETAFKAALVRSPDDGPSRTLLSRIPGLRQSAPTDWSGVWQMTSK
jgi:adenylate cyclase